MLIKNILIGMLVSLFFLSLSEAVIAENVENPYASFGGLFIPMNFENNNIEFEYSPIDFNSLASSRLLNTDSDAIDFDYSPREDTQSTVVLPSVNSGSEEIQLDYSPRLMNCGTPYC